MNKYYQKILVKKLSPIISNMGISQITKPIYSGKGQILMFHRVIPKTKGNRIHNHLSLEIEPDHLQGIIDFFNKRNYHVITLDMLFSWLQENKNNNKKFVIFTFDDGYKDNIEYAFPIFKKNNIPFTIYITTLFPEKKVIFWWYILEKIVLQNAKIEFSLNGSGYNFSCHSLHEKEVVFNQIRKEVLTLDEHNIEKELTAFFRSYGFQLFDFNNELSLNWDDIIQLSSEDLVTLGAHTVNHYNLCNLSEEVAFSEIQLSKSILENKTGKKIDHFSYPLGKYGEREIKFVSENKFTTSTTTKTANVFVEHVNFPFQLPRISVNSITNKNVLKLHINGFYQPILNKRKKIVY